MSYKFSGAWIEVALTSLWSMSNGIYPMLGLINSKLDRLWWDLDDLRFFVLSCSFYMICSVVPWDDSFSHSKITWLSYDSGSSSTDWLPPISISGSSYDPAINLNYYFARAKFNSFSGDAFSSS